jgi:RNA polymerase sigma-70 factor (ECF subfamily)
MFFLTIFLNEHDTDKFTRIYEKFHAPLLMRAFTILKSKRLAEDVVQDTFVRILSNLDKLSEGDHKRTWYYMATTAERICYTILKKEKQFKIQDLGEKEFDELEATHEPVWSEYQAKELYQRMKAYICNDLNETDRQIMLLRGARKMPYKEIAEIVGMSESNVSVRLTRLRKKMKSVICFGEAAV